MTSHAKRTTVAVTLMALGASVGAAQLAASAPAATHGLAHHKPAHHKPARAIAPLKAAWYDESRPTTSTPAAPMPGVGPHDLVVSGTTIATSDLPVPLPTSVPVLQHITAFTALAFRIPKGATPATLTLTLTGFTTTKITARLPSGVTPVACPTTSSFTAGGQQSVAAAPKFSCKDRSSIGQLRTDGKAVVFPGIGRLIRGHTLSFVVLPGTLGLDRMVFTRPGRTTLSLLRFLTTPTSTPTLPATPAPRSSGGAGSTTPPLPGNVNVPVPGEPRVSVPPDPGSSPQIATTTTQPALRTTAASPIDDTRARAAALALLVALVVTTLWLAVTDASGRAYTTMRVMRALSTGAALPELTAKEWGVGRFRGPRDGRPPPI